MCRLLFLIVGRKDRSFALKLMRKIQRIFFGYHGSVVASLFQERTFELLVFKDQFWKEIWLIAFYVSIQFYLKIFYYVNPVKNSCGILNSFGNSGVAWRISLDWKELYVSSFPTYIWGIVMICDRKVSKFRAETIKQRNHFSPNGQTHFISPKTNEF